MSWLADFWTWLTTSLEGLFLLKLINFLILAAIVVHLVRKYNVLDKVFGAYQRKIRGELEQAQRLREEAAQIKRQTEQAVLDTERQSALLLQQAQTQAQQEKEDIIEGAKVEAKRLLEQAHLGADFELRHQLQAVQRDVVERSVERARGILQKTMDQKDNVRLVDAFLRDLSEENLEVR